MRFVDMVIGIVGITIVIATIVLVLNRKAIPDIDSDNDVLDILRSGDRIKAIKAYRQLHGTGLKEAKKFIDNCDLSRTTEEKSNG